MKIFTVYSSQILANVENLIFWDARSEDYRFIQFALKICRLRLTASKVTLYLATEIVSMLKNILKNRNSRTISGDVIEKVLCKVKHFQPFPEICGHRNSSIKLSMKKNVKNSEPIANFET